MKKRITAIILIFSAMLSSGCAIHNHYEFSPAQLEGIRNTQARRNGNPQQVIVKKVVVEKVVVVQQQPVQQERIEVMSMQPVPIYQNAIYCRPWGGQMIGGYVPMQTGWAYPMAYPAYPYAGYAQPTTLGVTFGKIGHRNFWGVNINNVYP